jgi:hypothetical protein
MILLVPIDSEVLKRWSYTLPPIHRTNLDRGFPSHSIIIKYTNHPIGKGLDKMCVEDGRRRAKKSKSIRINQFDRTSIFNAFSQQD